MRVPTFTTVGGKSRDIQACLRMRDVRLLNVSGYDSFEAEMTTEWVYTLIPSGRTPRNQCMPPTTTDVSLCDPGQVSSTRLYLFYIFHRKITPDQRVLNENKCHQHEKISRGVNEKHHNQQRFYECCFFSLKFVPTIICVD